MNDVRYRWILYLIVFVIFSTIGIQLYWNYKNYQNSKQQLVNDVQVSLDKAVDDYYAHLAKKRTFAVLENLDSGMLVPKNFKLDSLKNIHFVANSLDSSNANFVKGITVFNSPKADSILEFDYKISNSLKANDFLNDTIKYNASHKFLTQIQHNDSLKNVKFRTLTSKVVISLANDSLSLKGIDSLLKIELKRKNIAIAYDLSYKDYKDSIKTYHDVKVLNSLNSAPKKKHLLGTSSESTFLPMGSSLTIVFTNETRIILKRIFGGMLISLLLVLAIISSLFYLLHIIKHQKQLAEVKNDLISNITHEFKTPIATIGVALESIKDFKIIEDKDKTKRYLDLSGDQLSKLNTMVEKLLETATLDSESLTLQKETIDVIGILKAIVEKHQMQAEAKTIEFSNSSNSILANVDVFHFENAVNNVLDNALKYGGNEIKVTVEQSKLDFTVSISDNGNSISKAHKNKIFEKFYRIPKGNTHDVKGFGIGLYYTKKIVDKHGGSINLELGKNSTTFKLTFPNE